MIDEWLEDFLPRLAASFPPLDWPEPGTEEWVVYVEDFRRAFARNGVSEDEAEEARSLLAEDPPRFKAEYIPKVVGAVKVVRALAPPGCDRIDDRARAADVSRGCMHCHGQGLALVYAARPDPDRRIPADVAAYCVCALGRWTEANHLAKSPDVHRRFPDLRGVIAGRSVWRFDPPGLEGLAGSSGPAVGVAGLVRIWTEAAREEDARPAPAPAPARPRPDLGHVEPAIPIPPLPVHEPDAQAVAEREESYRWI